MTNQIPACPFCDQDGLTAQRYSEGIEYNGSMITVDGLEGFICKHCGEQSVFPEQARSNQALINNAKRRFDGLLTGPEVKSIREHLGISQEEAASIFGGGKNAFSKYERGEVAQSVAMDRLMRVAIARSENFIFLCSLAGTPLRDEYEYLDEDHKVVGCNFRAHLSGGKIKKRYALMTKKAFYK